MSGGLQGAGRVAGARLGLLYKQLGSSVMTEGQSWELPYRKPSGE